MTDKQLQFAQCLESLVHKRFSKKSLERTIRNLLPPRTWIQFGWDVEQLSEDYDMLFQIMRGELYGFFDVYYTLSNKKACRLNGHNKYLYVTEVAYDFNN